MEFINIVIYTSIYLGLVATSFYVLSFVSAKKKRELLFSDKELPKVSVIIPVYNEEEGIERTLKTILASDYPKDKFEVIVVDDGSIDRSLELAKKFESQGVRVFAKKKNTGKGSALNLGIKRCKGEIVFSMDADTFVESQSLKKMTRYFKNKQVMSVSPAITIYKPKTILQRVQYIEYLLGLFLRKAFASVNAIHVTPGAFSAYRKSFFDKYGGYDENNITEDLELALRVQYKGYVIENCPEAPAYTIAPKKFSDLVKQRKRWYVGLMKNIWAYRKIFSSKYGDLGLFVLPVAWFSIFFCILITLYFVFKALFELKNELILLSSINYDFENLFDINIYFIERLFFLIITNPIVLFVSSFMIIVGFYLSYASKKLGKVHGLAINVPLYFLFFAVLFGFWWLISIVHVILGKRTLWR